ncbi:AAA family ATPase [Crenobacter intestini]|uniref:AAA family ATPase n=2 Tax=Crenobacter intestini TaxID=2563443 RepID=A0A4T0ULR1_9NEIS|nr:AAA family ATPase [Crenobacter intestini]
MVEAEALVPEAARVELVRADQIKIEPIRWLWDGWLACGKLHILAGAPGTGKTTIAMAMAATVTRGGRWPDGSRCARSSVLIWSGEDDPQDTLVPRLMAAGADLSRVFFVTGTRSTPDEVRPFDPAADLDLLQRTVRQAGDVRLMVVDPVVSAVSGDSHKNTEVRRALQPLVEMAGTIGCALVGITHFSKGTGGKDPAERVTGSIAFTALARVVLATAKREDDDGNRSQVLARAKSNIGQDHGGFAYEFEQVELADHPGVFASRVMWGEALEGEARELLGTPEPAGDGEGGTLADAKRFLRSLLEDGPVSSKSVKADADGAGYSWATIRRAQTALGVVAEKGKGLANGQWHWRLPDTYVEKEAESGRCSRKREDAQQKKMSTFGKIEHLRGVDTDFDADDDLDEEAVPDPDWLAGYDANSDEARI